MAIYRTCLTFLNSSNRQNLTFIRYIRNPFRRGGGPKLLEGTVKSNDEYEGEECSRISSYHDVMKIAGPKDGHLVEKALASEDDFGAALGHENAGDLKISDDGKSFMTKKIIQQKYFKMFKETNLLTCAAKEQIRHLHESNPDEWTPEALSEHFPISVQGAKKLLKSYFALKDPDRIKQHDAEIEEKWRALESGQPSDLISPITRKLWNEGKLKKLNYRSNPDLPSAPPDDRKTVIVKRRAIGQFEAIIQQYANYKAKTEAKVETSEGKEVALHEEVKKKSSDRHKFKFSNYKYSVEHENRNPAQGRESNRKRIDSFDDLDIVHRQFKTNMKEAKSPKEITSNPQYSEWMHAQDELREPQTMKKTSDAQVFVKIPKFKVSEDLKYNAMFSEKIAPNQKPEFQRNRTIKLRHRDSPQVMFKNKSKVYRKGQSIYDEQGQFLYKIPLNI